MYKSTIVSAICVSFTIAQTPLSFDDALQHRIKLDKGLAAISSQRSAAEMDIDLVKALAPTELEIVLEDFGQDEIEVAFHQRLDSPGIRKSKREIAESEMEGFEFDSEIRRMQLHHELSMYFLELARTSQELKLSQDRLTMTRNILDWQKLQFNEGALSESELIRTRFEIAGIEAETKRIALSRDLLSQELSQYLSKDLNQADLQVEFSDFPDRKSIVEGWDQLETAPMIKRQETQISLLRSLKAASDTPIIGSIGISAGMKILPEFDQRFPVFGVSLETPLFTKRSKSIQQSEYRLRAGIDELESINSIITTVGKRWMKRWELGIHELRSLEDILIPEARRLYERVEDEYIAGARTYLEVLDTQTLLTDLQQKEVELRSELAALLFEMNLTLGVTIYEFD
jgi:outer membrane protein TolC